MASKRKTNKAIKGKTQNIGDKINADKISVRNGVYTAKWMYFYTHGNTETNYAIKVKQQFPDAVITETSNNWNAWPKDSWFEVRFTI